LLSGVPDDTEDIDEQTGRSTNGLETRVAKLEQELAELRAEFDKLMKELT